MRLCRVLGNVVATAHHPAYDARTLLVVQAVDEQLTPQGKEFLAVDHAQAGEGDLVLVLTEGNGVRQILKSGTPPIRSLVVGVVDAVTEGAA